jgi:membrane fusion protein
MRMANDLFRSDALKAKAANHWGRPVSLLPPSWGWITALLGLFAIALVVFLMTASLDRKETVRGQLQSAGAEAKVFAVEPGILVKLHVAQGDVVQEGDVLAEILTSREIDRGTTMSEESQRTIALRQESLAIHRTSLVEETSLVRQGLDIELAAARSDQASLTAALNLVETRAAIAADRVAAFERLLAEGASSQEDLRTVRESLIVQQQQGIDVRGRLFAAEARESKLLIDIKRNHEALQQQLAEVRQRDAQLALESVQVRANAGYAIKAPVSGRVATLQAAEGERVDPTQPILTVLPEDQPLVAQLYVPTRAIAFVERGQDVRLLYDALPYQKFGSASGRVQTISSTTLSPSLVRSTVQLKEPVYLVTALLQAQTMPAYGKDIALQSGMEFTADLVLERRSLAEWFLEPLFAASARAN